MIEIKIPSPGESITEVEIGDWLVEDGALVEMDDELVEINSDKATLTVNAEAGGVVKILKEAGEVVQVGEVVATIDENAAPTESKQEKSTETADSSQEKLASSTPSDKSSYAMGTPSPAARKLLEENQLSAQHIQGTGKDGRITKGDVLQKLSEPKQEPKKEAEKPAEPKPLSGNREERRKRMTPLRRKIGERLVSAKNDTAMLTTFNEVDMHAIMELRKKYKEKFKETYGVSLGFMGFFTKAVCEAIKSFPAINAYIDGDDVLYHDYVDVGIAVSSDRGLVVPLLRNAESLSIWEIEAGIRELALKARDNKLTIEEMTGGTFTITNGGVFGSMLSTPILNPPQSAILGMHNIVERPVALNGQVAIRPIMYVALSYDHRIVDGKESVSFLYKVKEMLEDPSRMLLGI